MSVQNQIVKNVYEGNGSTTVFPYTFALNETDGEHVKVYIADESELSTPTDNFTIDTQLRKVTYPRTGAALPEGSKIVIRRELPNEQDTNLENNGAFFAETIEREFDREVMMIQQLAEQVDRAVKTDMSSVTTPDELIAELRAKAQAAVESASAALVSENNARASEQAAAQSKTNAESYKDTTHGYMTTAETSATTATNKATEASASASAAAQSKTAAEAAADTAHDYMIEAGASESIATQKATNAAASATAAATSEANARTLVNTVNPPWNIRLASTEYAVGDIAYSALLPSWAYIECTVGGTTSSGDLPVPSSVVVNDTFTDGTVTWMIRKVGFDNEQELATKANRQLSNLDTANLACHVVVDSYYDSTTGDWWREYDDGWVEQGGMLPINVEWRNHYTINLLKPYASGNWVLLGTTCNTLYTSGSFTKIDMSTTTAIIAYFCDNSNPNRKACWYACGMGASV